MFRFSRIRNNFLNIKRKIQTYSEFNKNINKYFFNKYKKILNTIIIYSSSIISVLFWDYHWTLKVTVNKIE